MIMIETTIQHNRAQYNKANSQKKINFQNFTLILSNCIYAYVYIEMIKSWDVLLALGSLLLANRKMSKTRVSIISKSGVFFIKANIWGLSFL